MLLYLRLQRIERIKEEYVSGILVQYVTNERMSERHFEHLQMRKEDVRYRRAKVLYQSV